MIKLLSPLVGLLFLLIQLSHSQSASIVSGSGSDILDSGSGSVWGSSNSDTENVILEGSGSAYDSTTQKPSRTSNTIIISDDEDDPVESGSGQGKQQSSATDDIEIGSGVDNVEEDAIPDMSRHNIRCVRYYCWCVSNFGQVPNSMEYFAEGVHKETERSILAKLNCESRRRTTTSATPTSPSPSAVPAATEPSHPVDKDIILEETMTYTEMSTPLVRGIKHETVHASTKAPYVMDGDVSVKQDSTVQPKQPELVSERSDTDGLVGGKNVERELAPPGSALFTHPGILAAIIGGGVVALLSALLLIMFIVYRMRKKDEGSYPLDPDSKPPRLHTYTRTPNKEFYA